MQDHFDSLRAVEKVKSVLTEHGINHDGDADQVCACEAAMVIDHLNTLLSESNALLKKAVSKGFEGMSPEKLAVWQGTAEGLLSHSKYLMQKDVEQNVIETEVQGENIVSLHSWASAKQAKKQMASENTAQIISLPSLCLKVQNN